MQYVILGAGLDTFAQLVARRSGPDFSVAIDRVSRSPSFLKPVNQQHTAAKTDKKGCRECNDPHRLIILIALP